jgi:tetratricopeptide (TPR) repeat protein
VLGIVKFGTHAAADRFVYLPTIPFYILIGIGITNLLYSAKITKILKLGIIIGVLLIGVVLIQLTQKQTWIWKNDLTFWGYIAAYAPKSGFPQFKLGYVYYLKGDYEKAIEHYHNAISLEPYHNFWYSQLPRVYIKSNKLQEALRLIDHVLEHNIDIGYRRDGLYYLKGLIYAEQGFFAKAQKALTTAVEINPNNNNARNLLLEITSNKPKMSNKSD